MVNIVDDWRSIKIDTFTYPDVHDSKARVQGKHELQLAT